MKTFYESLDFVIERSRQLGQNDEKINALKNETIPLVCCKENATTKEEWDCEKKNQKILNEHNSKIQELELSQWGLSREINTIRWLCED